MDENQSSEASPNHTNDGDTVDINSKSFDMLKNDTSDTLSLANTFSDAQNENLLHEASKIFQIGVEKDFVIWEKNKIIQDSAETIDTLKRNIYHIQVEYEKLEQNYQKEKANAAEALKRSDVTKNLAETAIYYSKILAESLGQLENDKIKIADYYCELFEKLINEEEKRKKIEILIKEQRDFTEKDVSQMMMEKIKNEQQLTTLMNSLSETEYQLKSEIDKNVELESELEKFRNEIKEMRSTLAIERTNRIKYQIIQSQFKKRILQKEAQNEKSLTQQTLLHKKKLKLLKSKLQNLREKLEESEENASNYVNTINDLELKVTNLNNDMMKASENHLLALKQLEDKMKASLTEKAVMEDSIQKLEQENIVDRKKIDIIREENMILISERDAMNSKLLDKEIEIKKMEEKIAHLEEKVKELSLEIDIKTQKVNDLIVEIQTYNSEELLGKIKIYENKLISRDKIEKELRDEIVSLKETINNECAKNEKVILQNLTRIQSLEKEILELQTEKENVEKELELNRIECTQVKSDLSMKSADLEKITQELQIKMKMVSNETELSEECKMKLEHEKKLNEKLVENVKKLKNEKANLDRELSEALERENLLKQNFEMEKRETEMNLSKLNSDLEQGKLQLRSQEEKLFRAENKVIEMENLSKSLKDSEEIINNLRKTIKISEANVEAYKTVIKKLEEESTMRKNFENETIKRLQEEISQLKQLNQKNETFSSQVETPRSSGIKSRVNANESECKGSVAKKTPKTSRMLISTPKRLMENTYISPNFKSISPIMKAQDPYNYDSDGDVDITDSDKFGTNRQTGMKKGIFTSRRKK